MVFFTCNNCNESLKLNKVDGHKFKCKYSTITCVDCLKDFDYSTVKSHKVCMTEDQRYGGKDYQAKPQKGLIKQQNWIEKLQELIDKSKFERETTNYLNKILNYDNIPRKKPKFINFIKSSIVKDERTAEKLWSIIEPAIKPAINKQEKDDKTNNRLVNDNKEENKMNNSNELNGKKSIDNELNGEKSNDNELNDEKSIDDKLNKDLKRKLNDEPEDLENKKIKTIESQESDSMNKDQLINKAIDKLIERSKETNTFINPIKLTKKILKHQENKEMKLKKFKKLIRRVRKNTEFNELELIEYYDKFIDKLNTKDCFLIDREMIVYK